MKIIRIIIASFSMYSRLPVPYIHCDEDETGHVITALPLTGAVIGLLSYILFSISQNMDIPLIGITIIFTLIPLFITGGFHVDGFMDVKDALNSGAEREKKLEIMKDPHIGAFAVINLVIVVLCWTACLYILLYEAYSLMEYGPVYIYFASFFLVRAFSALSSLTFPKAKKDGMLNMESRGSGRADMIILIIEMLIGCSAFVYFDMLAGFAGIAVLLISTAYYKRLCTREFGGVTGDTAGFYIVISETAVLSVLALISLINVNM